MVAQLDFAQVAPFVSNAQPIGYGHCHSTFGKRGRNVGANEAGAASYENHLRNSPVQPTGGNKPP
ncbi:MAG: hypothetical protein WDM77_01655 [Steroidobacteraceae bacterium]